MIYFKPQNWSDFKHGMFFKALIDDTHCIGKISIENGQVYLCQNKVAGSEPVVKFGFDLAWSIGGKPHNLENALFNNIVEDLVISEKVILASKISDFQDGIEFIAELDGEYSGKYCSGIISIDETKSGYNYVYICQDIIRGDSCNDKKGYKLSYLIKNIGYNIFDNPEVFEVIKWIALIDKIPSRKDRINSLSL